MKSTDGLWRAILTSFGIGAEFLRNRHGPCPGCGGKDRFRFDDRDGRGTWYCNGGGSPSYGDGYDLISHVTGGDKSRTFREVQHWLQGSAPPTPSPAKIESLGTGVYALKLWGKAVEGVAFHPYAKTKRITWEAGAKRHRSVSGRVVGYGADCVLVPIRDLSTGDVVAVQAINDQGKKQTFGPIKGNGFVCGNTLDKTIPWYVLEGWADAVSMVFHHHKGNAAAFAALGLNNLDALAQRVAEVYEPERIVILEDAA
jgi:putative DNA primase/helicase